MSWFRVSLSASQSLLADAAPLCHGLAKYAGFDQHESSVVGEQLHVAVRKAQSLADSDSLIDIVCRVDAGHFEASVTRAGQTVDTITRPLTKAV